jgi:DNA-binding CsgD family transcriptional regulator
MDGESTRARIRELVGDGAATLQQIADALGIRMQTVAAHISRMPDAAEVRAAMDRNKPAPRTLTAFGETKTVTGWARDPRSRVSRNTLRARLDDGWSLEDALTTGPRRRGQTVTLTVEEAAALKAAADRLCALPQVHRNTPPDAEERAATRELRQLMRQAAQWASVAEIARAAGLSHQQARYHLQRA